MPPTRVKGVRLSKDLWDEVEADARKRGVSANAEAARRIESASHRQASPGSRVRVQADSLDACVAATLALADCGLLATRPPAKSGTAAGSASWKRPATAPRAESDGSRPGVGHGGECLDWSPPSRVGGRRSARAAWPTEGGARAASAGRAEAGTVADACTLDGEKIKD